VLRTITKSVEIQRAVTLVINISTSRISKQADTPKLFHTAITFSPLFEGPVDLSFRQSSLWNPGKLIMCIQKNVASFIIIHIIKRTV
jgi:hypothetical protein